MATTSRIARKEFVGEITLYAPHDYIGCITKHHACAVRFFRAPFARCPNAVYVDYRLPNHPPRVFQRIIQIADFSILILVGWHHPDSPSYLEGLDPLDPSRTPRLRYHERRDPRWLTCFNRVINPYLATARPRILADFRHTLDATL